MDSRSGLEVRIGKIALAQAEIDERLVDVLIELLQPLTASKVEILVGKSSLEAKLNLIKELCVHAGISITDAMPSGVIPSDVFGRIKRLNQDRNLAVHSYYSEVKDGRVARFRSRKPTVETVSFAQLETLAVELSKCADALSEFAELLSQCGDGHSEHQPDWETAVRGVHEVITAGHLHERGTSTLLSSAFDIGAPIRLALDGTRRRVLLEGQTPSTGEFSATIDPTNWLATIVSPQGERLMFGDTGWRDVTALAREEDAGIVRATIRRIGSQVLLAVDGSDYGMSIAEEKKDRLAERAFGPIAEDAVDLPDWVLNLPGFAPSRDNPE